MKQWDKSTLTLFLSLLVQFRRWLVILGPCVRNVQLSPKNQRLVNEFLDHCPAAFSSGAQHSTSDSGRAATSMENVAVFDSPGKGRGLKATKEFWAGDVIFSEASISAVVFDRYITGNTYNYGCSATSAAHSAIFYVYRFVKLCNF